MSHSLIVLPEDTAQPILDALSAAKRSIQIRMFLFTDPGLTNAVIAAKRRGVKVRVMLNPARRGGESENDETNDKLAHEAEEERVDAGLDPYDPAEVPPATDTEPLDTDVRDTEQYQEERAEVRREEDKDEILIEGERQQFPPSHYEP